MSADFSLATLVVVWIGAFLGAFAAGGAGFAFALAASAVWLHVLDPLHTTAMVVASGTLLHGILIWPIRRSIEVARLWPFVAGAAFGIPAGVGGNCRWTNHGHAHARASAPLPKYVRHRGTI